MWYPQKLVYTLLIVTLTLSLTAGDKLPQLWKRLQALQFSANTIPLFYTYAVKNVAGPRRIRRRLATEGTNRSNKLAALARDVDGNYYEPMEFFEEPFIISIKNVKAVNQLKNISEGHYGPMASFTMETRVYRLLRVPSEDSVLNLPLPPGSSGKPFVEIPGVLTGYEYKELLPIVLTAIKRQLSKRFTKITNASNIMHPFHRRVKDGLREQEFPLPVFLKHTPYGPIIQGSYYDFLKYNRAILLLHCRNDDPTSYYTLVWHPDHPKYTPTTLLSHLAVTYDTKKLFMFETSSTFGGTLARVRKSLASYHANVCTDDINKFKVVFTYHH
ncbi:hypothetical protein IWQ62_003610 [Dispira parvispora]|uniref:Uncharacterized protein n=1 Tax=Dispira parvispora TaxID=1520584 RepID=A0A9W8AQK3_9FUNG|nr:hypothetical protein IWQ62_003610 [Dispira parvispora]